jgi:hypothetical protein
MGILAGIHTRTLLFINENDGWEKTISDQAEEIPALESLLADKKEVIASHPAEQAYFQEVLTKVKDELRQLSKLLQEQQQRLREVVSAEKLYNFDALCSQDILRDRIRDVQQRFIELKCNFLRYLSGVV